MEIHGISHASTAQDPVPQLLSTHMDDPHMTEREGGGAAAPPKNTTTTTIIAIVSMDPTSKKHHSRSSKPDPVASSSLQRPTSQHPKTHHAHQKPFAPIKGANPPWVDTTLQVKAMTLSTNAGPSKSTKKQQHPQPNKPITATKAHRPKKPMEGEKKGEEEEKKLVLLADGRRRSFDGPQMEVGHILSSVGAKIVAKDMPPFMQIHAVTCARKTYDGLEKFSSKALALTLKKEFDGVYGPAWHCIVGTSFGSFVTHSVGGFIYFSMDKLHILLFKTAVQRAE